MTLDTLIPEDRQELYRLLRLQLQAGQGMQISSQCTSRYQYFDWGKNHRNVQSLRRHLEILSQRRSG